LELEIQGLNVAFAGTIQANRLLQGVGGLISGTIARSTRLKDCQGTTRKYLSGMKLEFSRFADGELCVIRAIQFQ